MKVYFLIVGSLVFLLGIYLLYRRIYFLIHSQSILGKVISYEARTFDDSQVFYPVITFMLGNNQEYTFTSVAGSGQKQYPEGHVVTVRYLPEKPQDAFINSFLHFWAAPVGCIVLGSAGIAVLFVA
jgi:Protein of unknown function (DUF3592)